MAELLSPDQIPPAVRGICETLRSAGFRSWVVGGGIRDALIARHFTDASVTRRPAADWDIATDAVPEQVKRVFRRVIPTGIEHGTVTVVIDHEHFEVTTLRTEAGYRDGRRPDRVQFVSDIADDLGRRDFTVNAIAYDVLADQLIDPFRGLQDLEHRLLRAVGNPADRFAEDGLRILRAARFVATLELELDPATRDAITPALGSYRKVSAERIRDEWLKTLKARRPSRGFRIMQEHGMLAHSAPELTELATPSAGEDAWTYSLRAVDLAPARAELRLAALLHRLEAEAPGTGTARIEARLRQLRFSGQEVAQVRDLVRHHRIDYRSEWSDAQVRRWLRTAGPTLLSDLLELGRALAQAHSLGPDDDQLARIDELGRRSRDQIALGAPLALSDLKIGGTDLIEELGITPGRQIGMLLGALLEKTLDDPELNERTRLLEAARGLASSEPV